MKKIKYLFRRIKNMSYKAFLDTAREIKEKTGKNRLFIICDMTWCGLKYQAGYLDYKLFEMYDMNKYQRKTVVTRGINNSFIVKYNDPKFMKYLNSKIQFNQIFSQYINRDWLELKNEEELVTFIKKHQKIVAKPVNLMCGKGIEIIDTKDKNIHELYETLILNQQLLIEEVAIQTKEMSDLHPDSINTIRVVTLLGEILAAFLRIGNNYEKVDNFNHGGIMAPIDLETGEIKFQGIDKAGNLYEFHPLTKTPIKGFKIPRWEEVKDLCEKATLEIPQLGYVGWDVCIGKKKCFLIEGNEFPGHDVYGLPPHRINNIGLYPRFKEIEMRKKQ